MEARSTASTAIRGLGWWEAALAAADGLPVPCQVWKEFPRQAEAWGEANSGWS